MEAVKHDKGKPRPDLVLGDFMPALEHVVFVGTFGCHKYAARNFQALPNGEERYAEAAMRHYMLRRARGEIFDRETGEYHLAHEIWDKIAELYFYLKERPHAEYEATIRSRGSDLYYHPAGDWAREPFWFSEEEARQVIWHLASEGVRDLDVEKVPVEEAIQAEFDYGAEDKTATVYHCTLCRGFFESDEHECPRGRFGIYDTDDGTWVKYTTNGEPAAWTEAAEEAYAWHSRPLAQATVERFKEYWRGRHVVLELNQ